MVIINSFVGGCSPLYFCSFSNSYIQPSNLFNHYHNLTTLKNILLSQLHNAQNRHDKGILFYSEVLDHKHKLELLNQKLSFYYSTIDTINTLYVEDVYSGNDEQHNHNINFTFSAITKTEGIIATITHKLNALLYVDESITHDYVNHVMNEGYNRMFTASFKRLFSNALLSYRNDYVNTIKYTIKLLVREQKRINHYMNKNQ